MRPVSPPEEAKVGPLQQRLVGCPLHLLVGSNYPNLHGWTPPPDFPHTTALPAGRRQTSTWATWWAMRAPAHSSPHSRWVGWPAHACGRIRFALHACSRHR